MPTSPVRRGPRWSVSPPITTRKIDPPSSGVATRMPFHVASSLKSSAMKLPSGPSSDQTQKLRSK